MKQINDSNFSVILITKELVPSGMSRSGRGSEYGRQKRTYLATNLERSEAMKFYNRYWGHNLARMERTSDDWYIVEPGKIANIAVILTPASKIK